jgi:hypothetical protein
MMVRGTARKVHSMRAMDAGQQGAGRGWRRSAAMIALLVACAATAAAAATHDAPALRIPLEPMGYQQPVADLMAAGSPMLTVDFVDNNHLLVTFGVRRLMKREVDPPPDDDDRTIGARLVELPSGKMLARTEWRLHDRAQYLWNLGHGRFLLRVRDSLTLLAPMASADPEDQFQGVPLLKIGRHVVGLMVSSDKGLLTVETTSRAARAGEATDENGGPLTPTDPVPVQINFYRLKNDGDGAGGLAVVSAGAIRTRTTVALPMTTAGLLEVLNGGKNAWMFNFDEHAGKVNELAEWDTSCFPHATFVGPSEFVAFGCRGSDDKPEFAGFNLKGEEMWQQTFYESYVSPTFAFAPAAGRFALGRTMTAGELSADSLVSSSAVTGQDVRVYQSYSGKQLLRIDCSPVQRAGQNFALSTDGLQLAVIRQAVVRHPATKDDDSYTSTSTAVEVYALPPLPAKDSAEVEKAQAAAPADIGARIDDSVARVAKRMTAVRAASEATENNVVAASGQADATKQAMPGMDAGNTSESEGPATEGDAQPAGPRKPPTLYGPDEKPAKPQ